MTDTLKQAVKEHYQNQQLNQYHLEQLETIFLIDEPKPANIQRSRRNWLAYAAALLISSVLIISLLLSQQKQEHRIMDIATEIAEQHINQKPLEISSNDFQSVQGFFNKLDFSPRISSHFGNAKALLGGRYCSVQSIPAAQIRFNITNRPTTLYQAPYDPKHFGQIPDLDKQETPLSRFVKGVEIQIWVEKGLLMAAAQLADH